MQQTYERLHAQLTERGPWQHTSNGLAFFPGDPRPEDVDVRVIALALSRIARYNGQYAPHIPHYSVAQHAVLIARWMQKDGRPHHQVYAGLHHDDAEAYIGDNISQMKRLCPQIKEVEKRVEAAIFEQLGVRHDPETMSVVKEYDFVACATEVRDIMSPNKSGLTWGDLPPPRKHRIIPWSQDLACRVYLRTHKALLNNERIG